MPQIEIYSKDWCPFCDRAKALLKSKGQHWQEYDVEKDPARAQEMLQRAAGQRTVPQVFISGKHIGGFDELAALERAGKLDALLNANSSDGGTASTTTANAAKGEAEHVPLVIIGSGPAGYTAALYAARAELAPVVLAGLESGGQLMLTTDVENYPGFPEGCTGPGLMELLQKQAERFGARIHNEDATAADFSRRPFTVQSEARTLHADAVIVATGASAKWLGLPSEKRLQNRGVSACATCDGALFRGKEMAVVGGGDTAMEEALFLTRYAKQVTVIHRRAELRASKIMAERARSHAKINFLWNSAVEEVLGDEFVTGLRCRNLQNGAEQTLPVEALFVAIGHQPNTALFADALECDAAGYLRVTPGGTRTNVEGVFACGDVMDPTYRQAITAAGSGCMAAIDCERWLAENAAAAAPAAAARASA